MYIRGETSYVNDDFLHNTYQYERTSTTFPNESHFNYIFLSNVAQSSSFVLFRENSFKNITTQCEETFLFPSKYVKHVRSTNNST